MARRLGFEGGQMPMARRMPEARLQEPVPGRGLPVNVATLEAAFDTGATVDVEALRAKGLVPKKAEVVKILGDGELTKALTVQVHRFSKVAKEKIEAAGGKAETLEAAAAQPRRRLRPR